jgi:pimeloyl-ACP methyl ester carboxylesterase
VESQIGDVTVSYEDIGSGTPLLTLHGWPLDHRHMQNALEPVFAGRPGWRRLYPDLPGMGRTHAPDSYRRHDGMLEAVLGFVDAVIPGERFAVAGTSYGGYLARALVHELGGRVAGVLLTVPAISGNPDPSVHILPEHVVRREDPAYLGALAPNEDGSREMVVAQSMEVLDTWRRVIDPAVAAADYDFLDFRGDVTFSFDPDDLAEPFEGPSLIVTGRFDHVCGYREAFDLLGLYPFASYAALDWAGHALPDERSDLYRALVSDWLERVEWYLEASERGSTRSR